MNLPALILASASPRRSALLREAGWEFQIFAGSTVEVQPEHLTPRETCQINAYRKARVVAKRFPDALVLGADTIVCLDSVIFGKPLDLEAAHRMLTALQGRQHRVLTGVCLIHLRAHRQRTFAEATHVTMRTLQPAEIQHYLEKINPCDKAGAYAIQEHGDLIVEKIDGSFSNVVGLPLEKLREVLAAWEKPAQ